MYAVKNYNFYHDMQISWLNPGSPSIRFPDSLLGQCQKTCTVLAPTTRCVTCTLHVLTLVTCNIKSYKYGVISSGSIASFFFNIFTIPTIQRHTITSKTFGKAEGGSWSKTIVAMHVSRASLLWHHLPNDFFSIAEVGKSVITDVNSTSGDIHHSKIPLLICNWVVT